MAADFASNPVLFLRMLLYALFDDRVTLFTGPTDLSKSAPDNSSMFNKTYFFVVDAL